VRFGESLKIVFQSRRAKKSKIVDKVSSMIEVFAKGWSKNSFVCKITFKIGLF
jgi:hypothetical protein